jgi:Domain of unknown function (DUF4249)
MWKLCKIYFSVLSVLLFFSSCEKEIDLDLNDVDPKLVVEATIENGQPPFVVLTRSLDYFSTVSPEVLEESFVHNAQVEISNGVQKSILKEYSVDSGQVRFYYYTVDSAQFPLIVLGELGKSYTLRITLNGINYNASTTIPQITRRIDSLYSRPAPNNPDTTLAQLMITAGDIPGLGDYIRYFTKRNQERFLPGFNSVFDDQLIDGQTYTISVDGGVDKNAEREENEIFFKKGDTVVLKLANIDRNTFDFWRTFEFSYQSIGNPFSSPTKVIGNISDGALGYFGGYAVQYKTVIIPK